MTGLYSKGATRKLWDDLLESKKKLTVYCRVNRLSRQALVLSVQKHFPQEWAEREHTLGPIPTAICEYCGLEFVQNVSSQRFCTSTEARRKWDVDNPTKGTHRKR